MIQEAINKIEELVKQSESQPLVHSQSLTLPNGDTQTFQFKIAADENGRELGAMLQAPRPSKLIVSTLTGFLDAIKAGVATVGYGIPDYVIHVEDYLNVVVKSTTCDAYGMRDTLLLAKHEPIQAFEFGKYYTDPAQFIIALQSSFLAVDGSDMLYLIRIASSVKTGDTIHVADDGFGQTISLQSGEVQVSEHKMKPRVKLVYCRTFPEANEVESEFLVRLKQMDVGGVKVPAIALFDVDGGKWKGDTMRSIKKYLETKLQEGTPILA